VIKKFHLIVLLTLCLSSGLLAQEVVLSDEFDEGDGKWTSGWIDEASTDVTVSIDTNEVLSGKNSYLLDVVEGGPDTYRIQRNADCPLLAGYVYNVTFLAVADRDVTINVLFEIAGSPYTKRLNEWPEITTTPQAITYEMTSSEDVPDNQLKLHFGGPDNDNYKIWIDSVVVTQTPDPTLVDQWGLTSRGTGWPILNDSETAAGDASIGDPAGPQATWHTMRGEFDTLQATIDQAVVVTGKLEYVGGGCDDAYGPIRYALTFQENTTLQYQYTDSAMWAGGNHWGYEFTPRTGKGTMANGGGGIGTVWTIVNGGGWNSTWSNNGKPIAVVNQAPRNAEVVEGVYNWAISVNVVDDTTNEIRWYLVEENNEYWYGGTVIDTATTTKFNGICLSIGDDLGDSGITEFNVSGVRAFLGDPIVVPEAPFEPFYVDRWGLTSRGTGWPILNDSTTIDGNASMGDPAGPQATWHTIRGGFGLPISALPDEAIIVSGQLEYVGGDCGAAYGPIRYALTYQPEEGQLQYQYTDSAMWEGTGAHYGYEFTPRTGSGTMANGGGGIGTVWLINGGGGWNSTWSNNGYPLAVVNQVPHNAEITEGTYDWAISVQPLGDGTNEVRWSLVKVPEEGQQTTYWYCGITIDTAQATTQFNGICFGIGDDLGDTGINQFNIIDAYVNRGDPIELPPRPIYPYYIALDNWGFYGDPANRMGGWQLTPGDLAGNVSISGDNPVAANQWASIRGGFDNTIALSDIPPDTALVITGTMELVGGGFDGYSGLRFGLFYSDSAGVVDSTEQYGQMWTGKESYSSGYLFIPNSGTNVNPHWGSSGQGSFGGVVNSSWLNTDGAENYILSNALTSDVAGAGEYDFKLSIYPLGDGTVEIGCTIENDSYYFETAAIDDHDPLATSEFNAINIALFSTNATTTGLNVTDVQVKLGSPVVTSIENVNNGLIPEVYSLSQNYPNPFNPTTKIKFGLPQQSDVKLVVYDVLGRIVAELQNKKMSAGYHEVTFNASRFSSGMYFYRIEAGDFVSVKRMMLLK
jgi:hypothetical protein